MTYPKYFSITKYTHMPPIMRPKPAPETNSKNRARPSLFFFTTKYRINAAMNITIPHVSMTYLSRYRWLENDYCTDRGKLQ